MQVSEFLAEEDAWTIYDADEIFSALADETDVRVDTGAKPKGTYMLQWGDKSSIEVEASTAGDIIRAMEARGLGGTFNPGDTKFFIAGYTLAFRLAYLIAGKISDKSGRGFSFRDNIRLIKEAEDAGSV